MIRRGFRLAAASLVLALGADDAGAQVTLRGGIVLQDAVIALTGQGVTTAPRLAGGAHRVIPWDMVRAVAGEFEAQAQAFAPRADAAWRARARLARGDDRLAEPALAALYEELKHEDGPLTLRVSEGLLRCRLIRGDQAGAAEVWLTALRLRGTDAGLPDEATGTAGSPRDSARAFAAVIDPETGLCPALPPMWTDPAEAAALSAALRLWADQKPGTSPASVRELALWYARAAALDAGETPAPDAPSGAQGDAAIQPDGLRLIADMASARDADQGRRRAARDRLSAGLDDDADTWKEAWRRAALGRSLLMESDANARSQGLVHLLHLPARFGGTQPYLAGVAVVEAANELKRRGDKASLTAATRLITDLKLEHPFHPALRAAGALTPIAPASNPSSAGGTP